MAYYSRPSTSTSTMSTSTPGASMNYAASSSMNSEEFYFSDDENSVDFRTMAVSIDDRNCVVDFEINKGLAEGGQYEYKFLAFDDSSSEAYHTFDRENPTEEWKEIFYSHSPQKHLTRKVVLSGQEIVLMTGPITSQFTSVGLEDFIVKRCFHGIFIFVNNKL